MAQTIGVVKKPLNPIAFELFDPLAFVAFGCHMGRHMQQMGMPGGKLCVLIAGVVSFRPAATSQATRYAIVNLDGGWEVPEEDRPPLPSGDAE